MIDFIKKTLKGAINVASGINYYSNDTKTELLSFIDNLEDRQYMSFDIQDFDETLSVDATFDYSTRTITNSTGGDISLYTNKISKDYSSNHVVLDFIQKISTSTTHTFYISVDDVNYVEISEDAINFEIVSETGFRIKVDIDDGVFTKFNLGYKM